MDKRYFLKQVSSRGRSWYVCDRQNFSLPIFDKDDKPSIFHDEDEAIEALEIMNTQENMPVECPCGNVFDAIDAKSRGENSGRFFNESVARSDIHAPTEFQCPKCLLWQKVN